MRRRLCLVLPDLASARRTADDLLRARVEDRHMHFLGRRDVSLGELHAASVLQKTDVRHAFFLGAGIGVVGGAGVRQAMPSASIVVTGASTTRPARQESR